MSYKRKLNTFGPEYEAMLLKAHREGQLVIPTDSEKQANSLRAVIYWYFKALRDSPDTPRKDLIDMAAAFIVRAEGPNVMFAQRRLQWHSQAILKVLAPDLKREKAPTAIIPLTQHERLIEKFRTVRMENIRKAAELKKSCENGLQSGPTAPNIETH